ncbi:hypothetical protein L873DRAFT_618460 [Choiromyces venosus 120613-1]|uniref:Uncharacterized protein n=1 Tax=Choiromyces venosus 120613-1 TaxID=1336337 RepID=A0A3N4IXW2_9PEZI|nr:hypothetical protein L873DRAFT_618460 [Choiromyces venosus 120613-1]
MLRNSRFSQQLLRNCSYHVSDCLILLRKKVAVQTRDGNIVYPCLIAEAVDDKGALFFLPIIGGSHLFKGLTLHIPRISFPYSWIPKTNQDSPTDILISSSIASPSPPISKLFRSHKPIPNTIKSIIAQALMSVLRLQWGDPLHDLRIPVRRCECLIVCIAETPYCVVAVEN